MAKKVWLRCELDYTYAKLADTELRLYNLNLSISKDCNEVEFLEWIKFSTLMVDQVFERTKNKVENQQKKLNRLLTAKNLSKEETPKPLFVENFVSNLSSQTFTPEESNLLNKGLNYAMRGEKKNEVLDVVVCVETAIKYRSESVKQSARSVTKSAVENYNSPVFGTSRQIPFVIKSLREKDCYYLRADKGNSIVIMDKDDYKTKIRDEIEKGSYEKIRKDPLPKMIRETNAVISEVRKVFSDGDYRGRFLVSNPKVPSLYGLCKIHKPDKRMRLIVSNIDAPSYSLAKWLVGEFRKLNPPDGFSVKNSFEVAEKLKNITIQDDEVMVSFDIVSFFPSVPIPEALQNLEDWLTKNGVNDGQKLIYMRVARMCMDHGYFKFDGDFYKITHGTNMGHPLSPDISGVFASSLETALSSCKLFPRIWLRYVDDVFAVMNKNNVDEFLEVINKQHPAIKFTVELESYQKLPFLDLELTRTNGKIDIGVFRKSTSTERFITSDSWSPIQHKLAAFQSMVHRLCKLPLSIGNYKKEYDFIKHLAKVNGYKTSLIDQLIKKKAKKIYTRNLTTLYDQHNKEDQHRRVKMKYVPEITNKINQTFKRNKMKLVLSNQNKLKTLLGSTKDKLPNIKKSGIYEISCGDCSMKYYGQTKRSIEARFKEHKSNIRLNYPSKSAFAAHVLEENHLNVPEDALKLLKVVTDPTQLDAYESFFIYKNRDIAVNTDNGNISSDLFTLCG